MEPTTVLLGVRMGLAALVYVFLAAVIWMLWQDLQAAGRVTAVRSQRLGQLVVMESDLPDLAPGVAFPLLPVSSLGRAPTNTAAIPDDTCSLEHALLHLREGKWWLEDLASRNGTRLNDAPLTAPTPILPGDVIGIGRVKLRVELG